jgi:thiol-disulfide isomerase/thioredoxin
MEKEVFRSTVRRSHHVFFAVVMVVLLAVGIAAGTAHELGKRNAAGAPRGEAGRRFFSTVGGVRLRDYSGREVALSDFSGAPLVLNTWASWCPFCRQELVDFAAVQEELGDKVKIIAINRAESLEVARRYTSERGVEGRLTLLLDTDDTFYRAIGGFSMPETILVDAEGRIRDHKRGPMDAKELREKVLKIVETK